MYLPQGAMKRLFLFILSCESGAVNRERSDMFARSSKLTASPLWFVMDIFTPCL
jgi:hypothetical protein